MCKLNSHVLHPQVKSTFKNKESAKLMNHDTTPSSGSTMGNSEVTVPTGTMGSVQQVM